MSKILKTADFSEIITEKKITDFYLSKDNYFDTYNKDLFLETTLEDILFVTEKEYEELAAKKLCNQRLAAIRKFKFPGEYFLNLTFHELPWNYYTYSMQRENGQYYTTQSFDSVKMMLNFNSNVCPAFCMYISTLRSDLLNTFQKNYLKKRK